jgi:hypothetical protein
MAWVKQCWSNPPPFTCCLHPSIWLYTFTDLRIDVLYQFTVLYMTQCGVVAEVLAYASGGGQDSLHAPRVGWNKIILHYEWNHPNDIYCTSTWKACWITHIHSRNVRSQPRQGCKATRWSLWWILRLRISTLQWFIDRLLFLFYCDRLWSISRDLHLNKESPW